MIKLFPSVSGDGRAGCIKALRHARMGCKDFFPVAAALFSRHSSKEVRKTRRVIPKRGHHLSPTSLTDGGDPVPVIEMGDFMSEDGGQFPIGAAALFFVVLRP
jgi:hypothetical protein